MNWYGDGKDWNVYYDYVGNLDGGVKKWEIYIGEISGFCGCGFENIIKNFLVVWYWGYRVFLFKLVES